MTLDLQRTLRDALALFRRDRALLLPIAGLFLFLPTFAVQLLVPGPPALPGTGASDADRLAWAESASNWAQAHGGWHLLAFATIYWGEAAILSLYLDRDRPDVAGALRRGTGLLPRYLLASVMISIPAGLGLWLLVLPGLYVMGRTMLTGPALVAERPLGAARGVVRALSLSRGSGLALTALAGLFFFVKWIVATPFLALDGWLRMQGPANPLVLAIADAGAAAAVAAGELGFILAGVVAYRRLASSGT